MLFRSTELFEIDNCPAVVAETPENDLPPEIKIVCENGIPVIFADNLKDNQRLFREFEGKETKLKTEEIDGVVFATDKKAAENGIYAYYVKQDGKIVSNVEFYYKKVRIKEKENRKWFENWFW